MSPTRHGSVRQRGERWQARLQRADGSQTSKTFATERLAERWLRDRRAELETPTASTTNTTPTLTEWVEIWLTDIQHHRPSTIARDHSAMRAQILPYLGQQHLDELTTAGTRRWMTTLREQGLAPSTILRTLRVLGSCLQVAAEDGIISNNPARGIKPPRPEHHEQRFLTAAELERLATTIDPRYRGVIYLGGYGGLRAGEMFGLRVSSVNQLTGTVSITEQVVEVGGQQHWGPPKTAAGRRTVPLPRYVIQQLQPHLANKLPNALVFTAPEGGTVRRTLWAARFWRPACIAADLTGLKTHELRHTAVGLWIAAGATPLECARRAGHGSSARILDLYGHLGADVWQRTTDQLDTMAREAAGT